MGGVVACILGPLEIRVGGTSVAVAGSKQRAVLATLALEANRVVPIWEIVASVWGDRAPDGAEHSLQQHVSALRKLLEPERDPAAGPSVLLTQSPGYLLRLDALDADEFAHASDAGFAAFGAGRRPEALAAFEAALALWRGPALADVRDSDRLGAAATRLDEQRIAVVEACIDARLESGQAREVVPELEHLVDQHPFRERLRAQLMVALYRSGRQAEALAAFQDARRVLIDELGIEPGVELRDLEQKILDHDPSLALGAAPPRALYETFRADARAKWGQVVLPDGQAVFLDEGVTAIGRDPAAQVRLVDNRVSRHHARIETASGRSVLRDLGSTNGTTVNGGVVDDPRARRRRCDRHRRCRVALQGFRSLSDLSTRVRAQHRRAQRRPSA